MTNIISATITAYCACTICCGPRATGTNAANRRPQQGISIAAPRSIPLGSQVIIGTNTYKVDDRTARKYDGRFDVYFTSHQAAKQFGIKTQQVTIITH